MCCFSPVTLPFSIWSFLWPPRPLRVSGTQIFARSLGAEQALVYSMTLSAQGDVAMILPLPVAPGLGEGALEFVDLEGYASFFDDLGRAFEMDEQAARKAAGTLLLSRSARPLLVVHEVGAFEASFVPSPGDFDRLDPRFRLPTEVWARLPHYGDYGFAVFRLKKGAKQRIHPMAFRFKTRAPGRLFFPTVHVHDGEVHGEAEFDHTLYVQGAEGPEVGWVTRAGDVVDAEKSRGLVDLEAPLARRTLRGQRKNEDIWFDLTATLSSARSGGERPRPRATTPRRVTSWGRRPWR
jgi:hypothetical protein